MSFVEKSENPPKTDKYFGVSGKKEVRIAEREAPTHLSTDTLVTCIAQAAMQKWTPSEKGHLWLTFPHVCFVKKGDMLFGCLWY